MQTTVPSSNVWMRRSQTTNERPCLTSNEEEERFGLRAQADKKQVNREHDSCAARSRANREETFKRKEGKQSTVMSWIQARAHLPRAHCVGAAEGTVLLHITTYSPACPMQS